MILESDFADITKDKPHGRGTIAGGCRRRFTNAAAAMAGPVAVDRTAERSLSSFAFLT
jgi:hypothetical protein